ncbi:hypothetical protein K439DRAFT_1619866 [Ramaria rubella]|nr:hypothetical protein K439DRAFT_1619866 [Ramaria rubella]
MLAGIMRRMKYDSHVMSGIDLLCKHGIPSRDQPPMHFRRAARSIVQTSVVQKRTIQAHDTELQTVYRQLSGLQTDAQTQTTSLKHAMETGKGIERAYKRLCKTNDQGSKVEARAPCLCQTELISLSINVSYALTLPCFRRVVIPGITNLQSLSAWITGPLNHNILIIVIYMTVTHHLHTILQPTSLGPMGAHIDFVYAIITKKGCSRKPVTERLGKHQQYVLQ